MILKRVYVLFFLISVIASPLFSQEVLDATLLRADKLFIKKDYLTAVDVYLKYLEKYPRDYYAERQTAICYDHLNSPDNAIDHWPIVVESSEATEKDYLAYGRSLLANNRGPEAKKIFLVLSRSTDKSMAAWGKLYSNPAELFKDSATIFVQEVKGINTDLPEYSPVLFKDKLFYVSDKIRSARNFYVLNDMDYQTMSAALKKDSVNLFPAVVFEKLQTMPLYGSFCFSPDGATMYFTRAVSNKELKVKSEVPFFRYQIYTLTMSTMNNVQPEIKKFKHNIPEYDFMHPCLSRDGKRLYFVSNRKGSMGGKDVFMCELVNGNWTAPVNVGKEVNSPGNEVFPNVSEDGTLYFASDHRPGLGGLDVFYAKPSASKEHLYEEAKNLGAPINSRFDDFGLFPLKNGSRGYFSSNRKNNTDDDIYFFVNESVK